MARLSTVPTTWHQDILDMTAIGLSCAKMTKQLNEKYNTNIDDSAVYKVQKKLLKERQIIAQNVLVQNIEETAARDIRMQNEIMQSLYNQINLAQAAGDTDKYLKLLAEFRLWHSKSISLTGMDKQDNSGDLSNSDQIQAILDKFGINGNSN